MSAVYLALGGTALFVVAEVLIWPYRRCPACDGGKRWSPLNPGRNWRPCPVCKGSGRQLRFIAGLFRNK